MTLQELVNIQKASGLNISEFTVLMPFDRTTWYAWLRGNTPDPLRFKLATARAEKLKMLVQQGKLPLHGVEKAYRISTVVSLLREL